MPIRSWNPTGRSAQLLEYIQTVLSAYQGMKLTLRQLYYQLVTINAIANKETEYKKIGELVAKGRYAELISWDAIEDRTRKPNLPPEFKNLEELVNAAVYSYELDYWENQKVRPEVWVEKDALSNIVLQAVTGMHTVVVVNRGYGSASSLYMGAQRLFKRIEGGQQIKIFYCGDHDPSGLDMVRDVNSRLKEFLWYFGTDANMLTVQHLALTTAQVKKYNPPPNPAKFADTRAADYIEKFGESCWELDALPPKELLKLIKHSVIGCVNDWEDFGRIQSREGAEKEQISQFAKNISK